jgi:hypothetical protein
MDSSSEEVRRLAISNQDSRIANQADRVIIQGKAISPEVVERCASFIKMRGNSVEFVHQSARDYLAGLGRASLLEEHEPYGHGEIALTTLAFLKEHLKANLLDLPHPDSTWTSAGSTESREKGLLAKVEYAATFWAQHLDMAGPSGLVDGIYVEGGQIDAFFKYQVSGVARVPESSATAL